jgi:hypothetical protein
MVLAWLEIDRRLRRIDKDKYTSDVLSIIEKNGERSDQFITFF